MTQHNYMIYPRTINKKELCAALGLIGKNGALHYRKLRKHYLTDTVLEKIGIAPANYNAIRIFTMEQTSKLIEEMDMNPQDFKSEKPEGI